jgi:hypothetical protein
MKRCPGIALSAEQDSYMVMRYSKNYLSRYLKNVDSGMIAGHTQAIDGAFLKANASKDSLEIKQVSTSVDEYLLENIKANTTPPPNITGQMMNSKR